MKHQARKRFGQHFLVDRSVLARIAQAVSPVATERIVEIGPGLGALTEQLLARVPVIDAVEIDRDLVARLRQRWPLALRLHEADALAFDFEALAEGQRLRWVGNLPYNISTPLMIRMIDFTASITDAHFMLQKEVVDRIVAEPGGAAFGRLGVMMQAFFEVEALFEVPPEAFDPPPRVDSAVVRLRPLAVPRVRHRDTLERLLAVAFGQRRKMLRGTLLPWLAAQGMDALSPAIGLSPTDRPEVVSVADWCRLADLLGDQGRPIAAG